MKFTVSSEKLSKHFNKTQGAVAMNPVMEILSYYKFEVNDNILSITATDTETTIITSMPVDADSDFTFTIPAKRITDTIRSLPDLPIEFIYDEEKSSILIKADKAEFEMVTLSLVDYPDPPAIPDNNAITINSDVIIDAFSKTAFATSNDEVRLAMQGVYVEMDFNKLNFVATDAHKLVKYTYTGLRSDLVGSFIIPKKSALLVKSVFPADTEVTMYITKKNVFFVTDEDQLICRLIEANYPDYNIVIPEDNPYRVLIDRKSLINALKRIIIFSNQATSGVKFTLSENTLKMTAQDIHYATKGEDILSCDFDGEGIKIGFSGRFLVEMLSNIDTDEVRIKIGAVSRPSLVLPEGGEDDDVELLMVLMPLVVQ